MPQDYFRAVDRLEAMHAEYQRMKDQPADLPNNAPGVKAIVAIGILALLFAFFLERM